MNKVRRGIVGAETIPVGLCRILVHRDLTERVSLTAICDPVPGRARGVADKFGVGRWFSEYEALLECDEVDAVTIASPISFHYEQVRQALLAGKHVHCNKTMSTTIRETEDLIKLARERNVRPVPSPGEMLRPHKEYIKKIIWRGEIGTLCW